MLIFWVVIIALAVWLLSNLFPRVTSNSPSQPVVRRDAPSGSPLEILQQRYARGEISRAEYEEMRRALQE
jgi:putative membrane protein